MEVGVTSTIQRRIKSSQSQLVMEMMIWYVEDVTMETQKMPVSTENTEVFVRICSVPPYTLSRQEKIEHELTSPLQELV